MKIFLPEISIEDGVKVYKGLNLWTPFPNFPVFGGQLISQCLFSCMNELPAGVLPHSLNIYFTRPCLPNLELKIIVKKKKGGKILSLYDIDAFQNEKLVCAMNVSVSIEQECSKEHQCESISLRNVDYFEISRFFEKLNFFNNEIKKKYEIVGQSIEVYVSEPINNSKQVKFLLKNGCTDKKEYLSFLGFISDFFLVESSLIPLNLSIIDKKIKLITSIDHKLYFHSYEIHSEVFMTIKCIKINNSKVLCTGYILNKENILLASVYQEGMLLFN